MKLLNLFLAATLSLASVSSAGLNSYRTKQWAVYAVNPENPDVSENLGSFKKLSYEAILNSSARQAGENKFNEAVWKILQTAPDSIKTLLKENNEKQDQFDVDSHQGVIFLFVPVNLLENKI